MKKLQIFNMLLDWASERELINHIPDVEDVTRTYTDFAYIFIFPNNLMAESFYDKINESSIKWNFRDWRKDTCSVKVGFCILKKDL
jgi:hypothetical protein